MTLKTWSRTDWLIIVLLAGLVLLFYWRIVTPDEADRQSFPPGDFYAQFWAFATYEVRELSAGRLPLWNPYTFSGAPFWADVQSAVFYPPSLLTILLSAPGGFSPYALEIEAIVHFWLAAVFTYLFIRELTAKRAAAVIAALTFTFSGYLTGYPSQQLAVLEADVWLPLILFLLYRASRSLDDREHFSPQQAESTSLSSTTNATRIVSTSLVYLILAGVAWGLALLAGHPQSALIVAYLSSAYFFFLWFSAYPLRRYRLKALVRPVSHWLLFLVTGLALAAIQFIPAVEYTLLSVRAAGNYAAMSGGIPITDVIQLLLPGQVSLYSPLYVGIIGLILVLWVIFAAPNRHIVFWSVVAALTFFISLGGNTFLYSPLYLFAPGLSIFRGQERWILATAFSLSVLVGYGFAYLLSINDGTGQKPAEILKRSRARRNLSRLTLYLLLFALLLDLLFFFGLNETGWTPESPYFKLLDGSTLLTLLLILAWLLWRFSPRLNPVLFTAIAAALICFDLFSVNWQTNLFPQPPEWHTQEPAVVQAIKNDATQFMGEPYRVYNEFRQYDNYGVPFELEDMWGASPLRPERYDRFLAPPMPIERTWELLNVRYVITWREELFVPASVIYQEPASDGTTYVHRLESVGPRAWLTFQAEIADEIRQLERIAEPDFDRWQTVLLAPEAAPAIKQLDPPLAAPVSADIHQLSRSAPTGSHLSFEISSPTSAFLVLSEPFYPGWRAVIDGQPAPLLRANYVLRAIPIPAGDHLVEVTFRPLSFTLGAAISATAAVIIVVVLVLGRLKRNA